MRGMRVAYNTGRLVHESSHASIYRTVSRPSNAAVRVSDTTKMWIKGLASLPFPFPPIPFYSSPFPKK